MDQETYFYSILHERCSCRQKNGDLRNIGQLYRNFTKEINNGNKSTDVLSSLADGDGETGLNRICCRSRFLSIPLVPMIDRSRDRIYDDRKGDVLRKDTPKLEPGYQPYDFPAIDGAKAMKVVPPSVKIEGALPSGF